MYLRQYLPNCIPILTGIGKRPTRFLGIWFHQYDFAKTGIKFPQYFYTILSISVYNFVNLNTGIWFENVPNKDMHVLYVCMHCQSVRFRYSNSSIRVYNFANTGKRFVNGGIWFCPYMISIIPINNLVNTSEFLRILTMSLMMPLAVTSRPFCQGHRWFHALIFYTCNKARRYDLAAGVTVKCYGTQWGYKYGR